MSATLQARKALNAHIWNRGDNDWYIEPSWCSERLFAEEKFEAPIWDPCCGLGTIPEAAIGAGLEAVGTAIVDRGYVGLSDTVDFLSCTFGRCSNIVCNPPFNIVKAFALHALSLADKVAMVCPTARLNAARWLQGTPLMRVWLMTPRDHLCHPDTSSETAARHQAARLIFVGWCGARITQALLSFAGCRGVRPAMRIGPTFTITRRSLPMPE
jgi:hypothetical protein